MIKFDFTRADGSRWHMIISGDKIDKPNTLWIMSDSDPACWSGYDINELGWRSMKKCHPYDLVQYCQRYIKNIAFA